MNNGKRMMNIFIGVLNGFYSNNIHHSDADSLYEQKNIGMFWIKQICFGSSLCQSKNDYKTDIKQKQQNFRCF